MKKETKKSAGHARKESPTVGKNGKRVGRPCAEESNFSVEYQIQNHKGFRQKVCQKAFIMIHGFGKRRLEILRKKMGTGSIIPESDYRRKKYLKRCVKRSENISCLSQQGRVITAGIKTLTDYIFPQVFPLKRCINNS